MSGSKNRRELALQDTRTEKIVEERQRRAGPRPSLYPHSYPFPGCAFKTGADIRRAFEEMRSNPRLPEKSLANFFRTDMTDAVIPESSLHSLRKRFQISRTEVGKLLLTGDGVKISCNGILANDGKLITLGLMNKDKSLDELLKK